jgi:hypothetical protein
MNNAYVIEVVCSFWQPVRYYCFLKFWSYIYTELILVSSKNSWNAILHCVHKQSNWTCLVKHRPYWEADSSLVVHSLVHKSLPYSVTVISSYKRTPHFSNSEIRHNVKFIRNFGHEWLALVLCICVDRASNPSAEPMILKFLWFSLLPPSKYRDDTSTLATTASFSTLFIIN